MRNVWRGSLVVCLLLAGTWPAAADDQAEAKALIDKAVKAAGGADKVGKLTAATWKGKGGFTDGNKQIDFTTEGTVQGLDKGRSEMEANFDGMTMKITIVLSGDKAWAEVMGQAKDAPEGIVPIIRQDFYAIRLGQNPLLLKDKAFTLKPVGEIKIGDRPALGVQVSHKDYKDLNFFFDKETGLPAKVEMLVKEEDGKDVNHELYFSEPKEFDGVKHFSKLLLHRDGKKTFEVEVSEVKAADKVDEALFKKP
jgi:hypothetical protein